MLEWQSMTRNPTKRRRHSRGTDSAERGATIPLGESRCLILGALVVLAYGVLIPEIY